MGTPRKKRRKQVLTYREDYYDNLTSEESAPEQSVSVSIPENQLSRQSLLGGKLLLTTPQEIAEDLVEITRRSRTKQDGFKASWMDQTSTRHQKKGRSTRNSCLAGEPEATSRSGESRQCHWIKCMKSARPGSKYCSDECGVSLATERILKILPEKVQEWRSTESLGERTHQKQLSLATERQAKFMQDFLRLDERRQELDAFIDQVHQIQYCQELDIRHPFDFGEDTQIPCAVLGHAHSSKGYLKCVDICFVKTEKNFVMEAKDPAFVPGSKLICDVIEKTSGHHCKRLAANCPRHSKRVQCSNNLVCGAPMSCDDILDIDFLDINNICRAPKTTCTMHYNWETIRRSNIDIQKIAAWNKQELLTAEIKRIKAELSRRGNLMDLLLNKTICHTTEVSQ